MIPLLETVDAVLFDLDGTLVETNIDFPLMKRRVLDLAAEHGIKTDSLLSLDILAIVENACGLLTSSGLHDSAAELRARAMSALEEIELRHARDTREIPFARELVCRLRAEGMKIGVVTRNCRAASETSLRIAGISPDVLICREDSTRHKPHPDPLLAALDALGARPHASIMVGDHTMDIEAGRAAGLKTIALLWERHPHDFFDDARPDRIACDLSEVLGAIIRCDS